MDRVEQRYCLFLSLWCGHWGATPDQAAHVLALALDWMDRQHPGPGGGWDAVTPSALSLRARNFSGAVLGRLRTTPEDLHRHAPGAEPTPELAVLSDMLPG